MCLIYVGAHLLLLGCSDGSESGSLRSLGEGPGELVLKHTHGRGRDGPEGFDLDDVFEIIHTVIRDRAFLGLMMMMMRVVKSKLSMYDRHTVSSPERERVELRDLVIRGNKKHSREKERKQEEREREIARGVRG